MSKDLISKGYMEMMKSIHPAATPDSVRRALVVGSDGKGNIGSAIAAKLIEEGFFVKELEKSHGDFSSAPLPHAGKYDSLVLCNGHTHLDWIEDCPEEQVSQIINDTLVCTIKCVQQFVRSQIDTPTRKYIVLIGSMAYSRVLNGSAVYCAAKAAVAHFASCIAWELAPKGFNVICIHPSNTEGTPMTEHTIQGLMRYRSLDRSQAEQYWGAVLPKHQWLQPEDIAEITSFFLSGKCDYLSGSQINLAGGQR